MSSLKNKKLVIFDLDGTLVNAYKAVSLSLNYVLKQMELPVLDDATIKRSVGWGDRNLICRFVPEEKMARALSMYRKHHRRTLRYGVKFLPYAKHVISDFNKRGFKL